MLLKGVAKSLLVTIGSLSHTLILGATRLWSAYNRPRVDLNPAILPVNHIRASHSSRKMDAIIVQRYILNFIAQKHAILIQN